MRERFKTNNKIYGIVKEHIETNLKHYAIVTAVLIIGIVLGIVWLNNINNEQESILTNYMNKGIDSLKNIDTIDYSLLLKKSLFNNISLSVVLWFAGCTVIGMPLVYRFDSF